MENVLMVEKDPRKVNFKHAAGGLQDISFFVGRNGCFQDFPFMLLDQRLCTVETDLKKQKGW